MILLLGGTSESVFLAPVLAEQGYAVLVSTATDTPMNIRNHPLISRRNGDLNEEELSHLIRSQSIRAIVDTTHPYAEKISPLAQKTAQALAIPYFLWDRPAVVPRGQGFLFAKDHEQAAGLAFSIDQPVLLTTGSRNLRPYVEQSLQTHIPLWVRVLPQVSSLEACRLAGVQEDRILTGRGPFSVEDNKASDQKIFHRGPGYQGQRFSWRCLGEIRSCQTGTVSGSSHREA